MLDPREGCSVTGRSNFAPNSKIEKKRSSFSGAPLTLVRTCSPQAPPERVRSASRATASGALIGKEAR